MRCLRGGMACGPVRPGAARCGPVRGKVPREQLQSDSMRGSGVARMQECSCAHRLCSWMLAGLLVGLSRRGRALKAGNCVMYISRRGAGRRNLEGSCVVHADCGGMPLWTTIGTWCFTLFTRIARFSCEVHASWRNHNKRCLHHIGHASGRGALPIPALRKILPRMATDNKYDRQLRLWGAHGQV